MNDRRTEVLIEKIGFLKDVLLEIYRFLKIDGLLEIDVLFLLILRDILFRSDWKDGI